jgi:hypothetical protein
MLLAPICILDQKNMSNQEYRYPILYKGMYWYGMVVCTAFVVMLIREAILNFASFGLPEYMFLVFFLAPIFYAERFVISRLLHLGETVTVDEVEIQYHHRGGKVITIRWDEIANLEYREISCILVITAPNPPRVIKIDNRMGKFWDLVMRVQDEMKKFAYRRRIRLVKA